MFAAPGPDETHVAETDYGKVKGKKVTEKVIRFAGIPYAKEPVGDLRFKPPLDPDPWEAVLDATEFGPICIQPVLDEELAPAELQSEDCLRLNVWTQGLEGKRPVMVFIHGGAYFLETTRDPLYDGTSFAERGDVVLVSLDYRLGALGFLYLDEAGGETYKFAKNVGLLDQFKALQWVKANIARFGGDPDNITIFGESAGGSSVSNLMIMPGAKGLFDKAIVESATFSYSAPAERAKRIAETFMAKAGAETVEDLVTKSADEIRDTMAAMIEERALNSIFTFLPVLDGEILPADPYGYIAAGNTKGIKLLNGTTRDEYNYWALEDRELLDDPAKVIDLLHTSFGMTGVEMTTLLEAVARAKPERSALERYLDVVTWEFFRYPHILLSEWQARQGEVWMYRFDWLTPVQAKFGAYHAIELPFVFHAIEDQWIPGDKPADLAARVQDAWIAFARQGDPNHPGLPEWPRYDPKRRATMIFNVESRVEDDPEKSLRETWDDVRRERFLILDFLTGLSLPPKR